MASATYLVQENIWTDKAKYDDAERQYYERLTKASLTPLAQELEKARQHLKEAKGSIEDVPIKNAVDNNKGVTAIESKLEAFEKILFGALEKLEQLEIRISSLESTASTSSKIAAKVEAAKISPKLAKPEEDEDDGVDLFASDSEEESESAAKIREERLAAYNAKKAKKPVLIAKSNVILDVKPWDDETDMTIMEQEVRKIETDGLLWGAAKLVPLAYGIRKLQISCVVEDDKVSIDWLQEQIEALEDYVQSVDIAAFNKI